MDNTDNTIDSSHLSTHDTLFLHIPFFVKNCNDSSGFNKFYLDTTGTFVDTTTENATVSVDMGNPSLSVYLSDTIMDTSRGSFCTSDHKNTSFLQYTYVNSGNRNLSGPPGNARADSLRIYLYSPTTLAWIDSSTIKINGIPIGTPYTTYYVSGGYNINVIDLTKYPAGITGQPFGSNTICDMNGDSIADALAEGSSFTVTATLIYDTATCPPYQQIGYPPNDEKGFSFAEIWAEYCDMCSSPPLYSKNPRLPADSLGGSLGANTAYTFNYWQDPETSISAPTDILGSFNLTACPVFDQVYFPANFNLDCPNGYWDLVVPLPIGYELNTSASSLTFASSNSNPNYTSFYNYFLPLYDSSVCSHATFPLLGTLIYEDITQRIVYVNFGKLPDCMSEYYSVTNIPSCVNIPLILECDSIPPSLINLDNYGELSYRMEYVCDSGCNSCTNNLAEDSIQVYYHCLGYCQQPPFTDMTLSFLSRTNIGDTNVMPPSFYSSCNPPVYPNSLFTVHDTLPLNYDAAYPGDQVEAQVNGGYAFVPSNYENAYLQIRYGTTGSPLYFFQLDPTDSSYFIIQGCSITALNGVPLILPASSVTNYGGTGSPVEMNFSIDSAIYNYSHSLDSSWMSDNSTENITVSAYIHLRVKSFSTIYPQVSQLTLRTEYMCKVNGADSSADTVHSCDSWGTRFDIFQPGEPVSWIDIDNYSVTYCDSISLPFAFRPQGALASVNNRDDFPDEFRPFTELDSIVTFYIPKGFTYLSSQFIATLDRYDSNQSNNHFRGGLTTITLPIQVYNRTNTGNDPNLPTEIVFRGLDSAHRCWPIIDQKSDTFGHYSQFTIQVNVKPACNAPSFDTVYTVCGYVQGTQQADPNFQTRFDSVRKQLILEHANPVTYLNIPPTTNDSSNLISFLFNICTSGSANAPVPWVAFENVNGYLFNMSSAVLRDSTTHITYPGTVYYNGSNEGAIFNLGDIPGGSCNLVLFSALIDPSSKSCPPPKGGDSGKVVVRYGNICSGLLLNPDSTPPCQYDSTLFYYNVYPASLKITNNGYSPDTLSLCSGLLTDSLTIASNELGTISDPTFWVSFPAGFTFDSIRFAYPCGGNWDTVLYAPDTFQLTRSGEILAYGYVLNKDLLIHGLRGTLHSPTTVVIDSNTVCVKLYLTATCGYNGSDSITAYTRGITTCSDTVTVHTSFVPAVNNSCCAVCYDPRNFDLVLVNDTASVVHAGTTTYYCMNILIIGSYTVDEQVNWSSCNVAFAPNAIVNVLNKGFLNIDPTITCHPEHICSHLYASCDTMWRGMFIQPGGRVNIIKDALVEDADSAIVSINNSKQQGAYKCTDAVFNKNYTDIVVEPYNSYDSSYAEGCLFTCRDFTDIPICLYKEYYHEAQPTTIKYPFTGQISWMGWDIDSVFKFFDNPVLWVVGGGNTFDNLRNGIYAQYTNMEICADTFQDIHTGKVNNPAIYSNAGSGRSVYSLLVGNYTGHGEPNYFHNCTAGVLALGYFKGVYISENRMDSMNSSNSYGIVEAGGKPAGAIVVIHSNVIDSANVGIAALLNANGRIIIDSNTITGSNYCGGQTGVEEAEFFAVPAVYSAYDNTISNLGYGVTATGLQNDTIRHNFVYLNDTLCNSPSAIGIGEYYDNGGQVVGNTVSMNNHSSYTDYTNDAFTGIYAEMSSNCFITCNQTNYLNNHLLFNEDQTFTGILNNILMAGNNTSADTGIELEGATTALGFQGTFSASTDNQWYGTFGCKSFVANPAIPILSQFFVQFGASYYYPDSGACSPQIIPDSAGASSFNCSIYTSSLLSRAIPDSIAKNQIVYQENPDTAKRIAKQALTSTLWNKKELLNHPTLQNFNDSIGYTSLGKLMVVDSSINSALSSFDASALLSTVSGITTASNIEANMQSVAQIHLQAKAANTAILNNSQINSLTTIANLCPFIDGIGVYQARTLLAYYTFNFNLFNSICNRNVRSMHKVKKQDIVPSDTVSFNLYPNPNNGTFTLLYNLGKDMTGRVEIYNQLGMEVVRYMLNSRQGSMTISNYNLSEGLYIYKVYTDKGIIKIGKVIIIK